MGGWLNWRQPQLERACLGRITAVVIERKDLVLHESHGLSAREGGPVKWDWSVSNVLDSLKPRKGAVEKKSLALAIWDINYLLVINCRTGVITGMVNLAIWMDWEIRCTLLNRLRLSNTLGEGSRISISVLIMVIPTFVISPKLIAFSTKETIICFRLKNSILRSYIYFCFIHILNLYLILRKFLKKIQRY
jgi:hypothetical protein